jgi:hypothetical protein
MYVFEETRQRFFFRLNLTLPRFSLQAYPTTGEAVMGAGIQYINSHWKRLD